MEQEQMEQQQLNQLRIDQELEQFRIVREMEQETRPSERFSQLMTLQSRNLRV